MLCRLVLAALDMPQRWPLRTEFALLRLCDAMSWESATILIQMKLEFHACSAQSLSAAVCFWPQVGSAGWHHNSCSLRDAPSTLLPPCRAMEVLKYASVSNFAANEHAHLVIYLVYCADNFNSKHTRTQTDVLAYFCTTSVSCWVAQT